MEPKRGKTGRVVPPESTGWKIKRWGFPQDMAVMHSFVGKSLFLRKISYFWRHVAYFTIVSYIFAIFIF